MAVSDLQQSLLELSNQIKAGAGTGTTGRLEDVLSKPGVNFAEALSENSKEVTSLRTANQGLSEVLDNNTRAILQSSTARTSGESSSVGSTIGKVASTIFGTGLGLVPVVSSLIHLFTGGKQEPPPPILKYVPPAPIRIDGANPSALDAGIYDVRAIDYGQDGLPRTVRPAQASDAQGRTTSPTASSSVPITIHVQAMDSRSFLDHSNEIAQAVREAMLNMHSINDVVSDL